MFALFALALAEVALFCAYLANSDAWLSDSLALLALVEAFAALCLALVALLRA